MKKQINSVGSTSVKSILSATVLCTILGVTGVNANNYPSIDLNNASKDQRADLKAESSMNRISSPIIAMNKENVVKEEVTLVISQWMADSSYWSSDDSSMNRPVQTEVSPKLVKSMGKSPGTEYKNVPYIFNAQSFISDSEF